MAAVDGTSWLLARIYKRAVGNPSFYWVNSYEIKLGVFGTLSGIRDLLDAMVTEERKFHHSGVEFTRASMSSWEQDSKPYNPQAFIVSDYANNMGQRGGLESVMLPRNICLSVKRSVGYGRSGKLFYRGVLLENDIRGTLAIDAKLEDATKAELTTALDLCYTNMQQAITVAGGANSGLALIRRDQNANLEGRFVIDLAVNGVAFNKPDHKYFDRV